MKYLQRLYIGLNDKDTHKQEISKTEAKEIICNVLREVSCYTIIECEGVWLREHESSLIIEYVAQHKDAIISKEYIEELKKVLNQFAILQTIQELEIELI